MTVKFKNCAAQGDLYIRRVDAIPSDAKQALAENGVFIVAHSETGQTTLSQNARTSRCTTPTILW